MKKSEIIRIKRKMIREYAGSHFAFMINFLEGGFEDYVAKNWEKIAYKKSFGHERLRSQFKCCQNPKYEAMQTCEKIIDYVTANIEYELKSY